jgi:hypothetical protein
MDKFTSWINLRWHERDIAQVIADRDIPGGEDLTYGERCEILERVMDNHDAEVGVNWDVLEAAVIDYIKSKELDYE